jgi:hypothetical protein
MPGAGIVDWSNKWNADDLPQHIIRISIQLTPGNLFNFGVDKLR